MKKLVIFAALLLAVPALASDDFAVERFNPATDSGGLLNLESANVSDQWSSGALFNYELNPLRAFYRREDGTEYIGSFVSQRKTLHLLSSVSPCDWFSVGVNFPIVTNQSNAGDYTLAESDRFRRYSFVNPTFVPKVNLYNDELFSVAVAAPFAIPFMKTRSYLNNEGITASPTLLGSTKLGNMRLLANAGYTHRDTETLANLNIGPEWTGGAGVGLALSKKLEAAATVTGSTLVSKPLQGASGNASEYNLGLAYVSNNVKATVGFGDGLTTGYGSPTQRLFAGVSFSEKRKKTVRKTTPPPAPTPPTPPEPVTPVPALAKTFSVYFDFDKDNLRPDALKVMDELLAYSKTRDLEVTMVVGYADVRGSNDYNLKLGKRRAQRVYDYLVDNGAKNVVLGTVRLSEGEEKSKNDGTAATHQQWRRADIELYEGAR
jgi:outer membrane protein OmpA-like peptidoglycan-associated protein